MNIYISVEIKSTSKSLLTNEQLDLDRWHLKFKDTFEKFKNSTEHYGKLLLKEKVSYNDIQQAIENLINNNSLDEYRKRLLIKMRLDENTINEFASSLNLSISDLTDWN
ncbi:unnamed protein product [Rotaria sordida]|uniref:Uncharacterized protein n=1 Tax=Rotaria sordida TaxID=392033 RepID=A0A819Y205_9BILA|nr:unnamed protein product [Rotaria sordida]